MYPILFSIGPISISSLAVLLVVAWVVWSFIFWRRLRFSAVSEPIIFDVMFWATASALVGGRLGYVIFHLSQFSSNWLRIAAFWIAPGLSLYVALIASAICCLVLAKRAGVRLGVIADAWTMAILPSLVIGMLGGFLDGSIVGKATNLPWALWYVGHLGRRHPIELYSALVALLVSLILRFIEPKAAEKGKGAGFIASLGALMLALGFGSLEFLSDHPIYWRGLIANQLVLVLVIGQAIGGLFVLSGYHHTTASGVKSAYTRIIAIGGGLYERTIGRLRKKRTKDA